MVRRLTFSSDAVAAEASEAEKLREANGSGSKRTTDSSLRIDENEDLDSYAGEGIVDDEEYD